jgi:ribonuclease HI
MATAPDADGVMEIYTDGACKPNPGPGGWGALLISGGHRMKLYGGEARQTTNQRMELMGAIRALESLTGPSRIRLWTDSEYVCTGMSGLLAAWKSRGWRTTSNKPVENEDLWRRLDAAAQRHEVEWLWVKGHAGNPGNEEAHALAHRGLAEAIARASALAADTTGHAFDYTIGLDSGLAEPAHGAQLVHAVGLQSAQQERPDFIGE